MEWFYNGKTNFVNFATMLDGLTSGVYGSQFVEALLDVNWEQRKKEILWRFFSVYIVYVISSIFYMKYSLTPPDGDESTARKIAMTCFCIFTLLLWAKQIYHEGC